ncbi:MAG TPA: hypothetical protein VNM49_08160 [Paenibacillus cookii]|jgi:hypothetical protein|nr:hypothetical protein CM49_01250 [Paenibacillus sp. P1XP2]HWO54351.1 hypothetical protein [Paenibacillus cookii]
MPPLVSAEAELEAMTGIGTVNHTVRTAAYLRLRGTARKTVRLEPVRAVLSIT